MVHEFSLILLRHIATMNAAGRDAGRGQRPRRYGGGTPPPVPLRRWNGTGGMGLMADAA